MDFHRDTKEKHVDALLMCLFGSRKGEHKLVFCYTSYLAFHSIFQQEECDISKAFKKGCLDVAVSAARDHAGIIGTAGVIVACIMVMLQKNSSCFNLFGGGYLLSLKLHG